MKIKDIPMYILGSLISVGFFTAIYLVLIMVVPAENKDIALLLLGVLAAKFTDVVGYYFGSSKGSADKTEILANSKKPE